MFNSTAGRIILHLLAYGLAAAGIAILQQAQLIEFGSYQALISLALGTALDAIRKWQTNL